MKHASELRNRNMAIYAIADRIKWLVANHGVRDAKLKCSSVVVGDDLRVVLWKPERRDGPQMFVVYDGGHTVLSGTLNCSKPTWPAKYYEAGRVLVQTWHRGAWQRRLFEDEPEGREAPVVTPNTPRQKGLRLVHSSDE